jgi:hypothetical protein
MSVDLANWLGIAFIFGVGSFMLGWTACNVQWRRWMRDEEHRRTLVASSVIDVNAGRHRRGLSDYELNRIQGLRNDPERARHG